MKNYEINKFSNWVEYAVPLVREDLTKNVIRLKRLQKESKFYFKYYMLLVISQQIYISEINLRN